MIRFLFTPFLFLYNLIISNIVIRTGPRDGLYKYIKNYIEDTDRILNLGCGDGILSEKIRSLHTYTEVYDVDVVDLRHNKKSSDFSLYNGYDLSQYPTKHFDTVLVIYVLHHVPNRKRLLEEIVRVGKTVIIVEDILHEPRPTLLDSIFTLTHRLCSKIAFKDSKAYVKFWTRTRWLETLRTYDGHVTYTYIPEKKWFHYVDHGMFAFISR